VRDGETPHDISAFGFGRPRLQDGDAAKFEIDGFASA
jgi:hypothetical protein